MIRSIPIENRKLSDADNQEIRIKVGIVLGRRLGYYWCNECKKNVEIGDVTSGGYHNKCGSECTRDFPKYTTSLDACVEFEKLFKPDFCGSGEYAFALHRAVFGKKARMTVPAMYEAVCATPLQRCNAFLSLKKTCTSILDQNLAK